MGKGVLRPLSLAKATLACGKSIQSAGRCGRPLHIADVERILGFAIARHCLNRQYALFALAFSTRPAGFRSAPAPERPYRSIDYADAIVTAIHEHWTKDRTIGCARDRE